MSEVVQCRVLQRRKIGHGDTVRHKLKLIMYSLIGVGRRHLRHFLFLSISSKFHTGYRATGYHATSHAISFVANMRGNFGVIAMNVGLLTLNGGNVPRFSDQTALGDQLAHSARLTDETRKAALNALRNEPGAEKSILLSHLKHVLPSFVIIDHCVAMPQWHCVIVCGFSFPCHVLIVHTVLLLMAVTLCLLSVCVSVTLCDSVTV